MADTLTAIRAWAEATFFSKVEGKTVSRGAQDAKRPVVLDSTGKIDISMLGGSPSLTGLFVDGVLRVRQAGATRYRGDWLFGSGAATFNAYDDTGAVYLPLTIDTSTLTLRPSADATKQFTLDASGNIQALGRLGGAWTALTYTNGGGTTWADFAGSYQVGQYKKFGDIVIVRGLCKRTAGAGVTIANLPTGFRPTVSNQIFVSISDTGVARVDVGTSGNIDWASGGTGYLALNLMFSTL